MRQTDLSCSDVVRMLSGKEPTTLPTCLLANELGEIANAEGNDNHQALDALVAFLDDLKLSISVKYAIYMWANNLNERRPSTLLGEAITRFAERPENKPIIDAA